MLDNKHYDRDNFVNGIQSRHYRTAGGRFYVRSGKDKKDATGRELMRIAQAAGELHYDGQQIMNKKRCKEVSIHGSNGNECD